MQTRLVVAISLLVVLLIAIGILFWMFYYSKSSSSTYVVVKNNITVFGETAGIPCGALQLPCITSLNQTITAKLILFQGKYYYDSNYTVNAVVYMIWYDNSTYYCVSPTPPTNEHANNCP